MLNSRNNFKYFFFNGQKYFTKSNFTIFELLKYFNFNLFKSIYILEYNGLVCNESQWNEIFIKSNDKIELITIVGGG